MEIGTRKERGATVVTVAGRLDAMTTPDFDACLAAAIDEGNRAFVVDLAQLDYISSAGLRGILLAAKRLRGLEGSLRFAGVRGAVREVFDLSGFGSLFLLADSVDAALDASA